MIHTEAFPFIQTYLKELNEELQRINPGYGLSWIQRKWIAFCLAGILVTGTLCWSRFERFSLGKYSVSALVHRCNATVFNLKTERYSPYQKSIPTELIF